MNYYGKHPARAPRPAGNAHTAEAWIALYRRRAEAAVPPGLIPAMPDLAATRADLRAAALRAGDFRETPLNSG